MAGQSIAGIEQIRAMARGVRGTPEQISRASVRAANVVMDKASTQFRRDFVARYNLPASYVASLVDKSPATPGKPQAALKVRVRPIRQARYDARQMTAAALRSAGDAGRGIPAGRKAAGVSVRILRTGSRVVEKGAFLLPLRAGAVDGGNGWGVFVRTGPGPKDIKHLYSISPAQLFKGWRGRNAVALRQMLSEAFRSQLKYETTGSRK